MDVLRQRLDLLQRCAYHGPYSLTELELDYVMSSGLFRNYRPRSCCIDAIMMQEDCRFLLLIV